MTKDYTSPEYLAGRKTFLNDQETLFDLVVDKHGELEVQYTWETGN